MKKTFVRDVSDGTSVREVFLVTRKGKGVSRNGSPYLTITLADKSGEIEGRIWERASELDKVFKPGDFVRVEGKAVQYQGKPQITINDVFRVDKNSVSLSDFLRTSEVDPNELVGELRKIYKKISDGRIKNLIFAFLDDEDFVKEFKRTPAAKTVHHVYIGGLAEHILSLSNLVLKITSHYKGLNQDLLLAGAFFHDIGKVRELAVNNIFDYTDEGKLLGHLVIGCDMLEERTKTIKNFPEDLKTILKHIIVSHHGSLEFGSPKVPQTLEALILHYLDDIDAKLNTANSMLCESEEGEWTPFNRFLQREFLKAKVATSKKTSVEIRPKRKVRRKQAELDLFK